MGALNTLKDRIGDTANGGQIMYCSQDSMALPAYIVIWDKEGQEIDRCSYDGRLWALRVFAEQTNNQKLLWQVEDLEAQNCDCGECEQCEEEEGFILCVKCGEGIDEGTPFTRFCESCEVSE